LNGVALKTITVDSTGTIGLPTEALQESGIQPGSSLVVLARQGRIVLLDQARFQERIEKPMQEMLAEFRRAIGDDLRAPYFAGLTGEEYAALSDEAEQALWDRLTVEAEKQVNSHERNNAGPTMRGLPSCKRQSDPVE
jgi:bifunctional DNA-binding transcriptional regulator/antitoxin component of YhaV-PrlF toxin-antitoxin module